MNKLLTYYENMGPNNELTFKQLCRKIAVLFMLLGARKKQALLAMDVANVIVQIIVSSWVSAPPLNIDLI